MNSMRSTSERERSFQAKEDWRWGVHLGLVGELWKIGHNGGDTADELDQMA